MNNRDTKFWIYSLGGLLLLGAFLFPLSASAKKAEKKTANKLLYMYRFYYLPFSVDFQKGSNKDEVLPFILDNNKQERLIKAEELQVLDREWEAVREPWKKKSLFLNTPVAMNKSARISQHIASHQIGLNRTAFDGLSINDQIKLKNALGSKPVEVQKTFRQLRFLKSFLSNVDQGRFNFFIISPHWCESSKNYRVLFEAYLKAFPQKEVNLHSVVILDPNEQIFDSPAIRDMFPNPKKYTHESVPRFLALDLTNGKTAIYEEGDAIKELYNRYFKSKRGYLDSKTTLFNKLRKIGAARSLSSARK